jgi:hypothetical protein
MTQLILKPQTLLRELKVTKGLYLKLKTLAYAREMEHSMHLKLYLSHLKLKLGISLIFNAVTTGT